MSQIVNPKSVRGSFPDGLPPVGIDCDMGAATELIQSLISQQTFLADGAPFAPVCLMPSAVSNWTPVFWYEDPFNPSTPIYYQFNGPPDADGYVRALGDWVETGADVFIAPTCQNPPILFTYYSSDDYGALQPPVGCKVITGNNGDGTDRTLIYWELVPPTGYEALGICFTTSVDIQPNLGSYWCVRSDLCVGVSQSLLWSDSGFGWDNSGDILVPQINEEAVNSAGMSCLIAPSTVLNDCISMQAYGLVLSPCIIPANLPPTPPANVPQGSVPPTSFPAGVSNIVVVPWNVVQQDPIPNRIAVSPFYYFAAMPYYQADPMGGFPNPGGQSNKQISTLVGLSATVSETFTATTSLELSASAGAAFDGDTCGLTANLTETLSLEVQSSAMGETQVTVQLTVYPATAPMVYLWDLLVAIVPFRQDGSSMAGVSFGRSVVECTVQS